MLFSDKTQNNIMVDLIESVDGDISTEEGTLIDHSFRGAAAEFERAYIGLGQIDKNGYAQTADREHLMMRAKERGIEPFQASNAVWKARFNVEIPLNSRFSSKELTYACIAKIGDKVYKLMCEQAGISGNTKKGELMPLGYIDGFEFGELMELLEPARDEEGTEAFRARYFSIVAALFSSYSKYFLNSLINCSVIICFICICPLFLILPERYLSSGICIIPKFLFNNNRQYLYTPVLFY